MKKKVVWLLVSCLMVATMLLVSCAPAVTEEKKVAPPEEEEFPSFEQPFSIGETAQTSQLAVTILEAIITDSYEYYDQISKETLTKEASPGSSFLIATVEIKNLSGAAIIGEGPYRLGAGATRMYVYDAEGSTYQPQRAYLGEGRLVWDRSLSPDEEISGKVLLKIRKGATGLKIVYKFKFTPAVNAEWEIK